MRKFEVPLPAKPVVNLIYSPSVELALVVEELEKRYGSPDGISWEFPYTETNYYHKEMGPGLVRRLISFRRLQPREKLAPFKLEAAGLEKEFSDNEGNRRVNIDPGYVSLENFVLASGKNYSHRIYLGQGVFAEVTLIFRQGNYQSLDWTYPFYRRVEVRNFLLGVRERYRWQLRQP